MFHPQLMTHKLIWGMASDPAALTTTTLRTCDLKCTEKTEQKLNHLLSHCHNVKHQTEHLHLVTGHWLSTNGFVHQMCGFLRSIDALSSPCPLA
jgi:hypothetical protein